MSCPPEVCVQLQTKAALPINCGFKDEKTHNAMIIFFFFTDYCFLHRPFVWMSTALQSSHTEVTQSLAAASEATKYDSDNCVSPPSCCPASPIWACASGTRTGGGRGLADQAHLHLPGSWGRRPPGSRGWGCTCSAGRGTPEPGLLPLPAALASHSSSSTLDHSWRSLPGTSERL